MWTLQQEIYHLNKIRPKIVGKTSVKLPPNNEPWSVKIYNFCIFQVISHCLHYDYGKALYQNSLKKKAKLIIGIRFSYKHAFMHNSWRVRLYFNMWLYVFTCLNFSGRSHHITSLCQQSVAETLTIWPGLYLKPDIMAFSVISLFIYALQLASSCPHQSCQR